ncbi:C-type lectin domain family 10 member A [Haplochromis burtoni]|uniref:C-type lectin domain family 10 member A-like n=2 Tax=Haplochromis burtoni TaxID=8153 RepID=A0A3Q2VIN9_HAPBU|nr:C-type lectin domain family 10 member A [Haplochromis burtoni]
MSDVPYENNWDNTALWTKDSPPHFVSPMSRFKRWLFPGLTAVILLILIIVLGVTNTKTSKYLWSVDQRVSNMSDIIQSFNTSLHQAQETAKQVQQLQFTVENNKDRLTSVSEAMKQLALIDTLTKNIAAIKCSLEHIINNSSTTGGCCPVGWTVFESTCYFFSSDSRSWTGSRDWCETQQAHLVILRNDKEWDFVTRNTIPQLYWIGLSDSRTGRWEWVNQTPYRIERRRWIPGQPDSWTGHGLGGDEDCAHLHSDGRLNDHHCSARFRFICQKHSLNI